MMSLSPESSASSTTKGHIGSSPVEREKSAAALALSLGVAGGNFTRGISLGKLKEAAVVSEEGKGTSDSADLKSCAANSGDGNKFSSSEALSGMSDFSPTAGEGKFKMISVGKP